MTSTTPAKLPTTERVDDSFIHPFLETVHKSDGTRFVRAVNIHMDRVVEFIEGKTPCIMTNDGVPLGIARQSAYMTHLDELTVLADKMHESIFPMPPPP